MSDDDIGQAVPEVPPEPEQQAEPAGRDQRRDAHTREQLRATESERDALRGRVESYQRRQVEALARDVVGEHGLPLWEYQLDAVLTDGEVDPERVREALEPLRLALEEGQPDPPR